MSMFSCFLFIHDFKAVMVNHYYDTSYGPGAPSTTITYVCSKCGAVKAKGLYGVGFVPLEKITGASDER